jgi:hypothetical protein
MYDWSLSWVPKDKKCMTGHFPECLKTKYVGLVTFLGV